jgi:hypothetical protein
VPAPPELVLWNKFVCSWSKQHGGDVFKSLSKKSRTGSLASLSTLWSRRLCTPAIGSEIASRIMSEVSADQSVEILKALNDLYISRLLSGQCLG